MHDNHTVLDFFHTRNLACELAGIFHEHAVEGHAGQDDVAPIGLGFDAADARSDAKAFAKLDANVCFQGLVVEDRPGGLGFAELRAFGEIANELRAGSIELRSVFSTRS